MFGGRTAAITVQCNNTTYFTLHSTLKRLRKKPAIRLSMVLMEEMAKILKAHLPLH